MSIKISEPYRLRPGTYRCRVTEGAGIYSWAPAATDHTDEENAKRLAIEYAEVYAAGLRARTDLTVGGLLEQYLQSLKVNGRRDSTINSARVKIGVLVQPLLSRPVSQVTPIQAQNQYREAVSRYSGAYQRSCLKLAKIMWRWAEQEGLAKINPWANVRPVGRVNKGKEQLRLDEARKLTNVCLEHALLDDGALAVLLAICLALRSSEITRRTVRDVDDGGTRLIVVRAKTKAGERAPEIPNFLQPAMAVRTTGRRPNDLLLPSVESCSRSTHQWLAKQVRRYCDLAGVPRVCPHALRGGMASIAYAAGALPHLVAAVLGHSSESITEAHYATKASQEAGAQERRIRLIKPD